LPRKWHWKIPHPRNGDDLMVIASWHIENSKLEKPTNEEFSEEIQSAAVTLALLTAGSTSIRAQSENSGEAAGDIARPQTSSPTDFVDTLNSIFGKQTTQRATHAKGIVVRGKFTPAEAAQGLSKAPHFRQAVPVTVRFSDNTGIPTLRDADDHATPHGMALKFHLPDGSATDLVTHSFNGFPAATGDEMRQFLIAIGSSGAGVSSPTPLDTFLAAHPAAKTFVTTQDPPPVSYATLAYFGVNSFRFINAEGKATVGRYQIIPKAGKHFSSKEEAAKAAPDYLTSELQGRLAEAPIDFDFRLQLPESGDKTDDPSITWSDKNKTVELGVIEITSLVPDSYLAQRALLFLPGLLPVGIEPADPMIQFRNKAYPISYDRRHAGETK
jgi:catalase